MLSTHVRSYQQLILIQRQEITTQVGRFQKNKNIKSLQEYGYQMKGGNKQGKPPI